MSLFAWASLWLEPQAPRVPGVNGGKPLLLAKIALHSISVAVLLFFVSPPLEAISLQRLGTCNESLVNVPHIGKHWKMFLTLENIGKCPSHWKTLENVPDIGKHWKMSQTLENIGKCPRHWKTLEICLALQDIGMRKRSSLMPIDRACLTTIVLC